MRGIENMRTLFFRTLLLLTAIAAFVGIANAGPKRRDLREDRREITRLDETRETFGQIDAMSAEMNANDAGTFAIFAKIKKMAHHEGNYAKIDAKSRATPATFAATGVT